MELTSTTILVAFAGVFLICFMKGAFGGGFSIVGIPLLSLVMDPVTAGGLLAPLFIAMDLFALRYWKPSTWSKPDLELLLPGLVAGIGLGYVLFRFLDHRADRDRDGGGHPDLCRPVACCRRRGDDPVRVRSRRRSPLASARGSPPWWRIPADRRLRCICCRSASARKSTRERPACSSPSATRPRRCRGCCW